MVFLACSFTRSFDVLMIATSPKSEEVADLLCRSPPMMGYRSAPSFCAVGQKFCSASLALAQGDAIRTYNCSQPWCVPDQEPVAIDQWIHVFFGVWPKKSINVDLINWNLLWSF